MKKRCRFVFISKSKFETKPMSRHCRRRRIAKRKPTKGLWRGVFDQKNRSGLQGTKNDPKIREDLDALDHGNSESASFQLDLGAHGVRGEHHLPDPAVRGAADLPRDR